MSSAFIQALVSGDLPRAKALIDAGGVDLNEKNPECYGMPPLVQIADVIANARGDAASSLAAETLALYMIDHGADVDACDDRGVTALWALCADEKKGWGDRLFDALLARTKTVDAQDDFYRITPFMLAASRGHLERVQRLAAAGAEINVVNVEGLTPLIAAVDVERAEGNREVALWLIRQPKTDIEARAESGLTALDYAEVFGNGIVAAALRVEKDLRAIRPREAAEAERQAKAAADAAHFRRLRKKLPPEAGLI